MEKQENIKYFNFPPLCLIESGKVGAEKSLYKFTHVPLLKNDAQLKQNNEKKKGNHPNLLKKENHAQKEKKF